MRLGDSRERGADRSSRSSTLELSKKTELSQDQLKQWTKACCQQLPDISDSVTLLRCDLSSSIQDTNDAQREVERKVQNTLASVKGHI